MADAIITDVVQEHSRILTASDVVVDELVIIIRDNGLTKEGGTREDIILQMKYHQCKADSSEGRLEQPQVDGDVEREWRLSGGDHLKELVSIVVESTNVKAICVRSHCGADTLDAIEQFLQGLCTNHTIVSARFHLVFRQNTTIDVLDKFADMLCHHIGLQDFSLHLVEYEVGATFARMLRKNSSIKHLDLTSSLTSESDVQELIRSLVENHSLETLDLYGCDGVKGSVFPTIMDVLLVNFTLKAIKLHETPLHAKGKHLAINEQLRRNAMSKELHLKELEMAKPTSARVIFCGSPYAGTS
ncbi:unnamed protein product [Sphagnum tenellum]